jgi:hypothetical protein
LQLTTLGVAIVITAVLRLIGYPDLSRIVEAFLNGGGIASGNVAVVVGFIVAVLIWWAIAYFVATRVRRSRPTA